MTGSDGGGFFTGSSHQFVVANLSSRPAVLVTTHKGYTSGTEDCPFWGEAMPTLASSAIFPGPSI